MSTLTADRIRNHATRLGLTHLTDTLTELVERAETGQMGYLDFVDLLLEEEVGLREGRRFRNALKLSGLPHHKTLDQPPGHRPRITECSVHGAKDRLICAYANPRRLSSKITHHSGSCRIRSPA